MNSESLRFCRVVLWLGRLHGVFPYDKELRLSKPLVVYSTILFLTGVWWIVYAFILLVPAFRGFLLFGFNDALFNATEALLFVTQAVCFLNSLSTARQYRSLFDRLDDANRKFRRLGVVIELTSAPLHRELLLTLSFIHSINVIFVCTLFKRGETWAEIVKQLTLSLSVSAVCLSTKISCFVLKLVEAQTGRLSLELEDLARPTKYVGRARRVELLVRLYYDLVVICDLLEKRFAKRNIFLVGYIMFVITYFVYHFVDLITKGQTARFAYFTGNSIAIVLALFWLQILLFILYRTDYIKAKEEDFLQRLHKMIECDQDQAIFHNEKVRLPVYTGQQMKLSVGGAAPLDFTLLLTLSGTITTYLTLCIQFRNTAF